MLISRAEAKKAAVNKRIWRGRALESDPYRKNMDKIKKERAIECSKEERKKFIKKENSLKPVGVNREIIGEKQADNYTPSYYKTEDWKSRSKALIEKAGGKCSKCNYKGKGLTMHHLTYAYKPHTEPEEVLECLCKDCHHLKHEINRIIHGSPSRKIDQPCYLFGEAVYNDGYKSAPDRQQDDDRKKIEPLIKEFAPWMIEDNGSYFNRKLRNFLNVNKLFEIQEQTYSLIDSRRASALVIKSYKVSTSGDTRQHKDKMKKSFGLGWKGYKKQWEGRLTDEKLEEFIEYCESNGIEHAVNQDEN